MATLQTNRAELPLTTRAAVTPASVNEEARTVEVTWSTGADVPRSDPMDGTPFVERLSLDPAHVRLDFLRSGGPVLDSHRSHGGTSSVIGTVEDARIEGGQGWARIRFSEREAVKDIWNDVRSGILRHISVGYAVHRWMVERATADAPEVRTAIDWEPMELSVVPLPADRGSQVRSYDTSQNSQGDQTMEDDVTPDTPETSQRAMPETPATPSAPAPVGPTPEQVRTQERQRVSAIVDLCARHEIPSEQQRSWVDAGATIAAVNAEVLRSIEQRTAAQTVTVTAGDGDRERNLARDAGSAILVRLGHQVEGEGYRHFGAQSLVQVSQQLLQARGISTQGMSPVDLAKRAISTSDFASVLNLVGEKVTRRAYDEMELTHKVFARRTTASDFRAKHSIQISGGDALPMVPEGGKPERAVPTTTQSSYKLASFKLVTAFTFEMLVNDDIGMLDRVLSQQARAAAKSERNAVWKDLLLVNPDVEGAAAFSLARNNYVDGGAGDVSVAALKAARKALRTQRDPQGAMVNAQLKYLVVGPEAENDWDQLLNGLYVPTSVSGAATPTLKGIQPLVEAAIEGNTFFAFTDHNVLDTVEYAYLSGHEGPQISQQYDWETDGLNIKTVHHFGCGLVDYRGAYMNEQTE